MDYFEACIAMRKWNGPYEEVVRNFYHYIEWQNYPPQNPPSVPLNVKVEWKLVRVKINSRGDSQWDLVQKTESKMTNYRMSGSSVLSLTADKVRTAADKCSTASAVLRAMFPEAFEKAEVFYKRGDRFTLGSGAEEYILARTGVTGTTTQMTLISLRDGNRWCDGFAVVDYSKITPEEMKKISGNSDFKKI